MGACESTAVAPGAIVVAENLDGERMTGRVVAVPDATVADYEIEIDGEAVTLYRYWGRAIDADDGVATVQPVRVAADVADQGDKYVASSSRKYPYPTSKLSVVREAQDAE
jgi:hypothetical protein